MIGLLTDINESIRKNLPAQVAGQLEKRLEELEEKEKHLEEVLVANEKYRNEVVAMYEVRDDLCKQLQRYQRRDDKFCQDNTRLQEMLTENKVLRIRLDLKEQFAKEKCDLMMTMYKIPFANRTLREKIIKDDYITDYKEVSDGYDSNGCTKYKDEPYSEKVKVEIKKEVTEE